LLWPRASTPPALSRFDSRAARPDFAACASDGPLWSFGSQWSPTFSKECLSEAKAVREARSPAPYSRSAAVSVFA
jgi:hypothetical protein